MQSVARLVAHPIVIPPLGDRSVDCQLAQWVIALGDYVREGDPIVILETEKTAVELPAPASGTLSEVFVYEGEEVIEAECIGLLQAESYEDDDASPEDDDAFDDDETD